MVEKKLKESYCTQMKIAESRNGDMDIIKPKCFKCDRVILEIRSSNYKKKNNCESLFLTQYHQKNMGSGQTCKKKKKTKI